MSIRKALCLVLLTVAAAAASGCESGQGVGVTPKWPDNVCQSFPKKTARNYLDEIDHRAILAYADGKGPLSQLYYDRIRLASGNCRLPDLYPYKDANGNPNDSDHCFHVKRAWKFSDPEINNWVECAKELEYGH